MKALIFCTLLVVTTARLEAVCRCNFTQFRHMLERMHEKDLPEFERIEQFVDGIKTLKGALYENNRFIGHCGATTACERSTLGELVEVAFHLRSSASITVLNEERQHSMAVRSIEMAFQSYEIHVRDTLEGRPQGLEYYEADHEKLREAMSTICLSNLTVDNEYDGLGVDPQVYINQPVGNRIRRSITPGKNSFKESRSHKNFKEFLCARDRILDVYLPVYTKLHSAALQYLLMLQMRPDMQGVQLRMQQEAEFNEYVSLCVKIEALYGQCQTERMLHVKQTNKQSKKEFNFIGIAGITISLLVILAAFALVVLTARRQPGRRTAERVVTCDTGYYYKTATI